MQPLKQKSSRATSTHKRAWPGFEPGTTRTLSEYHTPRPPGRHAPSHLLPTNPSTLPRSHQLSHSSTSSCTSSSSSSSQSSSSSSCTFSYSFIQPLPTSLLTHYFTIPPTTSYLHLLISLISLISHMRPLQLHLHLPSWLLFVKERKHVDVEGGGAKGACPRARGHPPHCQKWGSNPRGDFSSGS